MEKQKLPNATIVLILGIFSILTCCFYGAGLILGGVSLFLAKKDIIMYRENTDLYSNYSNIKIGRVLSIIGIILSLIFLFLVIWLIVTFGWTTLQDEVLLKHAIEEKFGVPVK